MSFELRRIGLINWHKINTWQIEDIGNFTLIHGNNAAGKSTLMDAIQACIFMEPKDYNRAALESKRQKRTHLDYIRANHEGEYLRKGLVYTHIVCEFHDGDKRILVGHSARIASGNFDNNAVKKCWWTGTGLLSKLQMTKIENGKKVVCTTEDVISQVRNAKRYDTIEAARLNIPRLFGWAGAAGKGNFPKILNNHKKTVAYKPKDAENIHEYLKENIFDAGGVDIHEFQESLDEKANLQSKLEDIQKEVNLLKEIKTNADNAKEYADKEYIGRMSLLIDEKRRLQKQEERCLKRKDEADFEAEKWKEKKTSLEEQLIQLSLEKNNGELKEIEQKIYFQNEKKKQAEKARNDVSAFLNRCDDVGVEPDKIQEYISSKQEEIFENRKQISNAEEELEHLEKELKAGRVPSKLKNLFNEASFLCQKIECAPEWQDAAEAYIGAQRRDIVVNPEHYREAAKLVKETGFPLINLEGIREYPVNSNTLASVLKSDNIYVQAYINYKFGRVVLSDDVTEENYEEGYTYIDKNLLRYSGRRLSPMRAVQPLIGKVSDNLDELIAEQKSTIRKCENQIRVLTEQKKQAERLVSMQVSKHTYELSESFEEESAKLSKLYERKKILLESDEYKKYEFFDSEIKRITKEKEEAEKSYICAVTASNTAENEYKRAKEKEDNIHISDVVYIKSSQEDVDRFHDLATRSNEMLQDRHKTYVRAYKNLTIQECEERLSKINDEKIPKLINDLELIKEKTRLKISECVIKGIQEDYENAVIFVTNMNRILKTLPFNDRVYTFQNIKPAEGMEDLLDKILNYVRTNETGSLFKHEQNEEEREEIVNFLYEKILLKSEGKISADYTDYRTYCKFGLYRADEEGKRTAYEKLAGSSSASQIQIPIYLTLAAALYMQTNQTNQNALHLMCIDEAFDKLDSDNREKMVDLISKKMGIQLIAVRPDLESELKNKADAFIYVETKGNSRGTESYRIKVS